MSSTVEGLSVFSDILVELVNRNASKPPKRLKFINQSLMDYDEIERSMLQFFDLNMTPDEYKQVVKNTSELVGESRVCELILALINHSEEHMDRHVEMFEEVLSVIHKVQEMDPETSTNFAESAIDKCSLLIYDSYQILRVIRKKFAEIARVYHIPYFYDTDEASIRFRSSLLTTYKNLNTVMDDFAVLNEALWYIRHYEYITGKTTTN